MQPSSLLIPPFANRGVCIEQAFGLSFRDSGNSKMMSTSVQRSSKLEEETLSSFALSDFVSTGDICTLVAAQV